MEGAVPLLLVWESLIAMVCYKWGGGVGRDRCVLEENCRREN